MKRSCATTSRRRRGAVAVFAAISLVTLLLCASLAVDVGYICALTAEAQNNADATALAGASALKESTSDFRARALDVLARNQATQGFQSFDDQIIEVGRWDNATLTFSSLPDFQSASANAVRVLSVRADVPLFFASIMGHDATTVQREAVALVTPSCQGIWGVNSVTVPGSVTIDSWDGSSGPYDPADPGSNGDVCSNGTVTVSGSADVSGDVLASDITLSGGALTISGITEETVDLAVAPPSDFSDVEINNDNNLIPLTDGGFDPFNPAEKKLRIPSGDNLTLPPGRYLFTDLVFNAPATLTLTGPTEIYLTGSLNASGSGTINTTMDPADLTIVSSGTTVSITGSVDFYGSIYAPNADVTLGGNADFYGTLIGGTVDFGGNFKFHVDESLGLLNAMKGPVVLVR